MTLANTPPVYTHSPSVRAECVCVTHSKTSRCRATTTVSQMTDKQVRVCVCFVRARVDSMHLRGWVWPPGHLSGAISFCSALRFSCFIVPFGKQIWMLPRLLYTLSENKQIILCVSLHHLLILFPFFCFPFPAAYHMPTSLIDLALLLVSPCFVTPVWTSLFFFVVSFPYVYRCGARP